MTTSHAHYRKRTRTYDPLALPIILAYVAPWLLVVVLLFEVIR